MLFGVGASLIAAPAIVRLSSIMPVRPVPFIPHEVSFTVSGLEYVLPYTDNIITLYEPYHIDDSNALFIYEGSINEGWKCERV